MPIYISWSHRLRQSDGWQDTFPIADHKLRHRVRMSKNRRNHSATWWGGPQRLILVRSNVLDSQNKLYGRLVYLNLLIWRWNHVRTTMVPGTPFFPQRKEATTRPQLRALLLQHGVGIEHELATVSFGRHLVPPHISDALQHSFFKCFAAAAAKFHPSRT